MELEGSRDGEKFSKSVSCPVLEKVYGSVWGLKHYHSFRRWDVVLAMDKAARGLELDLVDVRLLVL